MRLVLGIGIAVLAMALAAPALADPPPPGLVAAYAFDEGSGTTAVDATGAGQHGAVVGATWAPGRFGGALSFDGADDYVGLPGLGTFYNAGFTLEAWVQKAATKNDVGDRRQLDRDRADALGRPSRVAPSPDARQQPLLATSTRAAIPAVGQWQHLAATFDGATARYYVDGVEVASRAFAGSVGTSNTWRIGAYGFGPGGFFDGVIDEVRVYDRALGAAEIVADRNQPLGLADPDTPTMPGNFAVSSTTGTSVTLGWGASVDDTGVAGYTVYVDDAVAGTTTGTSFTVTDLACSSGLRVRGGGVRRRRQHVGAGVGQRVDDALRGRARPRRGVRVRGGIGAARL